jgi:hypothetical protein
VGSAGGKVQFVVDLSWAFWIKERPIDRESRAASYRGETPPLSHLFHIGSEKRLPRPAALFSGQVNVISPTIKPSRTR